MTEKTPHSVEVDGIATAMRRRINELRKDGMDAEADQMATQLDALWTLRDAEDPP